MEPKTTRLRIKHGSIELDYEGSEAFLKEELPELLSAVTKLHKESGIPAEPSEDGQHRHDPNGGSPAGSSLNLTTTTIAVKLACKSGTDLIIAAAAKLTLVDKKTTFTRDALLNEMRQASAFFKKTFTGNLTGYLVTLVKTEKLVESAKNTYALAAGHAQQLKATLDKP